MTAESRPVRCSSGACVDARITDTAVEIRDTKQSISPVLTQRFDEWARTLADVHTTGHPRCVATVGDDHIWVGHDADGNLRTLIFDTDELAAFVAALHPGHHRVPAVAR